MRKLTTSVGGVQMDLDEMTTGYLNQKYKNFVIFYFFILKMHDTSNY